MLTGHLEWGTGDRPDLDQYVDGTYPTRCLDYSYLDGPKGQFRASRLLLVAGVGDDLELVAADVAPTRSARLRRAAGPRRAADGRGCPRSVPPLFC